MVLVKAWVKAELKGILQVGVTSPGVTSRRFRVRQRQHVQCVEVDETWRALKINDGETMVWCFVTKPGMHKFFCDGKNPTFASLNNKTITIDDWEFSSMSELCPAFDEKKAKSNGHICILINKFFLFGGERTTTVGKPSDLGEGNRNLRAIWRALSTPKDLVRALARGQGLTDLRDMDGVVMNAPESQVEGLSWADVEPALLVHSAAESTPPPPFSPVGRSDQQQPPKAGTGTPANAELSPVAGASNRGDSPDGERGGCGARGGESDLDGLSQQSLGMDYDGDFEGGGDDFQTQAPSAGNVFSQEEMDMCPASPTPPSPPPEIGGGGGGGAGGPVGAAAAAVAVLELVQEQEAPMSQDAASGSPNVASQLDGCDNAHDDEPLGQGGGVSGEEAQSARRAGSHDGGDGDAEVPTGKYPATRRREGDEQTDGTGIGKEREEEEDEQEDESSTDPIPPGFTQLDAAPPDEALVGPQPKGGVAENDDDDEEEQIGKSCRPNVTSGSAKVGSPTVAVGKGKGRAKGKGKGKQQSHVTDRGGDASLFVSFQQPSPPDSGAAAGVMQAAAGGGSGSGSGSGAAASQGSLSQEDNLSPQVLSGSSSSNIGSPCSNRLGLSCLTQKRQNEGPAHPNSGARDAAEKCDIRSVFLGSGSRGAAPATATMRKQSSGDNDVDDSQADPPVFRIPRNNIRGSGGGGGGSSGRSGSSSDGGALTGSGAGESITPTPDTVEMAIEDAPKLSVIEEAARKFPARPLQGGSRPQRKRPLSDVLVAVDPEWDGEGRPPVIARGVDADKLLSEWLDKSRPAKRPLLSIGDWLAKFASGDAGGGGGGGGGGNGGGSGGASSAGGGGSSSPRRWRR
ncbi:unnamed protein product [Pylaiella littoralis]